MTTHKTIIQCKKTIFKITLVSNIPPKNIWIKYCPCAVFFTHSGKIWWKAVFTTNTSNWWLLPKTVSRIRNSIVFGILLYWAMKKNSKVGNTDDNPYANGGCLKVCFKLMRLTYHIHGEREKSKGNDLICRIITKRAVGNWQIGIFWIGRIKNSCYSAVFSMHKKRFCKILT